MVAIWDEYISRDAVMDMLQNQHRKANSMEAIVLIDDIRHAALVIPAADVVEVRHGEWEPILATHWRWIHSGAVPVNRIKYRHNECGREVQRKEPYCPKCGAKMDGKRKDGAE